MAGEVQLDVARGLAAIGVGVGAAQVGVGQHPPAVVTQADARVGEVGAWRHGLHVHQRVVGFAGRVLLHGRHGGMIHAGHVAVVHARHGAVAHVGHAQHGPRVRLRHGRPQAVGAGQGAARVAAAVHALGIQGVGGQVADGHQHVVGFGHGDAQFVHGHGCYRQAVGGDHRQFQAGDAKVEIGHG
ncbi:hypothetical protein D3C81_1117640 [compost metagenome]